MEIIDNFLEKSGVLENVKVFESNSDLSSHLADLVIGLSSEAIGHHHKFTIALSGGSLPSLLAPGLISKRDSIQFEKWHVYFADERFVPLTDPESNYKLCKDHLFDKVPIPENQIYHIILPPTVEDAATSYQGVLEKTFGYDSTSEAVPVFDLILLGMGPDGHTASLFPFHPVLVETEKWVAAVKDSPKPPPERITFTLPLLNRAAHLVFVCTGEPKSETLRRILEDNESLISKGELPSRLINPASGKLYWFVDSAAASKLTKVPNSSKK